MLTNAKLAVGAFIISSKSSRVLFNMRTPSKSYGFQWSIWGGMIENEEKPIDALYRELSEEIGFVPDISRVYPFDIYESKNKMFKYITYVCVVNDEFIPEINNEAVGYAWLDYYVWPKPIHEGVRKTFMNDKARYKLDIIMNQHS